MFTKIENHALDGQAGWYWNEAQRDNYQVCSEPNREGICILHPGDTVRVESVWDRGDGFVLLYVYSFVTGQRTHIPEADFDTWEHGTLTPRILHASHFGI